MDALKSEIVNINLTGGEVENILMEYIYSKYPELKDRQEWEWEDFALNFNSKKLEDNALNTLFIRHSGYRSQIEQLDLPSFQTRAIDNV
jgi:hypothetical protein